MSSCLPSLCMCNRQTDRQTETNALSSHFVTITQHRQPVNSLAQGPVQLYHQSNRHARTDWNLASAVSTTLHPMPTLQFSASSYRVAIIKFPDFSATFYTCPELFACVTYDGLFAHVTKRKCFQTQLASCRVSILSSFRLHVMHNFT